MSINCMSNTHDTINFRRVSEATTHVIITFINTFHNTFPQMFTEQRPHDNDIGTTAKFILEQQNLQIYRFSQY